jgi:hypothetical protein
MRRDRKLFAFNIPSVANQRVPTSAALIPRKVESLLRQKSNFVPKNARDDIAHSECAPFQLSSVRLDRFGAAGRSRKWQNIAWPSHRSQPAVPAIGGQSVVRGDALDQMTEQVPDRLGEGKLATHSLIINAPWGFGDRRGAQKARNP